MRKILIFFLFSCLKLHAQYPSMSDYVVTGNIPTTVSYDCDWWEGSNSVCGEKRHRRKLETPPWIIPGGWRSYCFINNAGSVIWSSPKSLIGNSNINLKADAIGPFETARPYVNEMSFIYNPNSNHWRRNYHAIFSAHYFNHNTQGPISLGFCHSENKNVANDCYDPNTYILNTIQPNQGIDCSDIGTWSGPNKIDGWKAYNGILNAVWISNTEQTNWGQGYFTDLGPILWPSTGYVTANGAKASEGLRHPSSILYNDYLYIYVVDAGNFDPNTIPLEEGRRGGVKLIKVHKDEALTPGNYKVYYKDPYGDISWNPSLPAGLTKDNMLSYVAVKGSKSSDIFNDNRTNSSVVRFSVAKVRYTDYFIGVEQYFDNTDQIIINGKPSSKLKVAVRFSNDLINWSERQVVYTTDSWESSYLNYPIFLSSDGWSNTEVDRDDFYILGSEPSETERINKIHIYKYIPPPPPPPPTGECPPDVMCEVRTKKANVPEENLSFNVKVMPNPVSGNMAVEVSVETPTKAAINLYNAEGRFIRRLSEEVLTGKTVKTFDLSKYSSGIYYLEVLTDKQRVFKKVLKY